MHLRRRATTAAAAAGVQPEEVEETMTEQTVAVAVSVAVGGR